MWEELQLQTPCLSEIYRGSRLMNGVRLGSKACSAESVKQSAGLPYERGMNWPQNVMYLCHTSSDVWFERQLVLIISVLIMYRLPLLFHSFLSAESLYFCDSLCWVFCQTDCFLGRFNWAPSPSCLSVHRELCFLSLLRSLLECFWTVTLSCWISSTSLSLYSRLKQAQCLFTVTSR